MLTPKIWSALAVLVILGPGTARAQTVTTSFEELRHLLKKDQTIIVTDTNGRRTRGKVGNASSSALVVFVPEPRTFTEGSIREIRATDSLRNGALIGAGIGAAFATWDYLIDPSEPGNAVVFTIGTGLGAAIGAGIDALLKGVVYRSPQQTRHLTISPLAGKDRQAVLITLRY